MKHLDSRLIAGVALVLGGILFLLQNLGVISFGDLIWAALLGAAGVGFLMIVMTNRRRWWAIIPGLILTFLAVLIVGDRFVPEFFRNYGGALLLLVIAASFALIYALNQVMWWAIIPAGVMLTLAVVAVFENVFSGMETGGIFMLGLGLTFGLLALIETPAGRMRWPLIPAGILALIGLIITFSALDAFRFIWPILLILAGAVLFLIRQPNRRQ